ncbi:hypothetical protein GPECTOR_109g207 [Gonium pectorale]|uniref:Uncharacterized protein n=1 Tax=Gonium pectorale TaxID=33097 RepID=A0A150FZE0_GONPE|nr:hypothetical protein GPECTOR_109g207 [Gonium pectorale]|eukprot:KXZ42964.1 hypothetical protein GPECTOR_109g207 [Gonium pectorale]
MEKELDCSFRRCPGGSYHEDCMARYLRKAKGIGGAHTGSEQKTGYNCPATLDNGSPCPGTITKTHMRLPVNEKKKEAARMAGQAVTNANVRAGPAPPPQQQQPGPRRGTAASAALAGVAVRTGSGNARGGGARPGRGGSRAAWQRDDPDAGGGRAGGGGGGGDVAPRAPLHGTLGDYLYLHPHPRMPGSNSGNGAGALSRSSSQGLPALGEEDEVAARRRQRQHDAEAEAAAALPPPPTNPSLAHHLAAVEDLFSDSGSEDGDTHPFTRWISAAPNNTGTAPERVVRQRTQNRATAVAAAVAPGSLAEQRALVAALRAEVAVGGRGARQGAAATGRGGRDAAGRGRGWSGRGAAAAAAAGFQELQGQASWGGHGGDEGDGSWGSPRPMGPMGGTESAANGAGAAHVSPPPGFSTTPPPPAIPDPAAAGVVTQPPEQADTAAVIADGGGSVGGGAVAAAALYDANDADPIVAMDPVFTTEDDMVVVKDAYGGYVRLEDVYGASMELLGVQDSETGEVTYYAVVRRSQADRVLQQYATASGVAEPAASAGEPTVSANGSLAAADPTAELPVPAPQQLGGTGGGIANSNGEGQAAVPSAPSASTSTAAAYVASADSDSDAVAPKVMAAPAAPAAAAVRSPSGNLPGATPPRRPTDDGSRLADQYPAPAPGGTPVAASRLCQGKTHGSHQRAAAVGQALPAPQPQTQPQFATPEVWDEAEAEGGGEGEELGDLLALLGVGSC